MGQTLKETALEYQAAGLCVLPAHSNRKCPALKGWGTYKDRLPTKHEVDAWFSNGVKRLCVVLGEVSGHAECLDFDCEGEKYEAWRSLLIVQGHAALLKKLVIEKTPGKGFHEIHRCESPVSGSMKLATRMIVVASNEEVFYRGKYYRPRQDENGQWAIFPTLIETKGEAGLILCATSPGYELIQGKFTALPVLTTEERETLLEAAWSMNEHFPQVVDGPTCSETGDRPGDDFNRRGDIRELLEAHGWAKIRTGDNEHWRRPGKERGTSATLKNRTFYVFSSNAPPFEPETAYKPFAVYTLLEHNGDYAAAARALNGKGYGDLQSQAGDVVDLSLILGNGQDELPPEPDKEDPGSLPEELLRVPGFISEVMDYTLAYAPFPDHALAFAGALALQAALAGRKVKAPGGARPSLYLLGLAFSGVGKNYPREVNQRIMTEAGILRHLGDTFGSGEGLEDRMIKCRSMLYQTDEIDAVLLGISKSKDGRQEKIMQVLLKFYSSCGSLYHGRDLAGKEPEVIDQPNLVLYGTAVPKHYYESLCDKMLTNGFLARMLVFEAGERGEGQEPDEPPIPERVLNSARWWANLRPGEGNMCDEHPKPLVVPYASDAAKKRMSELRSLEVQEYRVARKDEDNVAMGIWARAVEKARRLSLVYACSEDALNPKITLTAVNWAWTVVEHQTRKMLYHLTQHYSENEFDARCKKMLKILTDWRAKNGDRWAEAWRVARRMKISVRDLEEVRDALLAQQRIDYTEKKTGGRPTCCYRAR
ncbi:MAG: DUF3987 domain-containing protein [Planctomycetota bacterium]|jgi:hypothetical protein|nr:DUF3987 domain-containing protein [Planctomycetota bacterium]